MPRCKKNQIKVTYVKLQGVKGWQGPLYTDREIEKTEDWMGHNTIKEKSKCVGPNTLEGQLRYEKLIRRLS